MRMVWLMLVGSIKIQVSFAKEPYKRDDILQKRPIILSILHFVCLIFRISMCDMTHSHSRSFLYLCIRLASCKMRHKFIYLYIQDSEDPQDALSCRSFSAKEPPIVGRLFLQGSFAKETNILIDPTNISHTIRIHISYLKILRENKN